MTSNRYEILLQVQEFWRMDVGELGSKYSDISQCFLKTPEIVKRMEERDDDDGNACDLQQLFAAELSQI